MISLTLAGGAIAGVAVLIARMLPKLSAVPRVLKWTHFGIVGIYSLVGIEGFRFLLMFFLDHGLFAETFSQRNILNVPKSVMEGLTLIFAALDAVLFVSVMLVGSLNKKARTIFLYLVFPCGVVYPLVVVTASGAVEAFPSQARLVGYCGAFVLALLAYFAFFFYRSKAVTTKLDFT